ncbi:MAG: DinB family protein [Candidatus Rokubacteria bacterium]|nr:DinB family protein [Candidatus Rokubacteria bacterium]
MADTNAQQKLQSYLAAQSAKLTAAEIRARLDEAAGEFFASLEGVGEPAAHRRPAEGEWSVAEVVDHVTMTLEDAFGIMRTLASGTRPGRPMTVAHTPVNAARPLAELVSHLHARQAALAEFLAAQAGEPHTDLRVSDDYFGEINWKGYALILRLHYKDHAQQVSKTRAAV